MGRSADELSTSPWGYVEAWHSPTPQGVGGSCAGPEDLGYEMGVVPTADGSGL